LRRIPPHSGLASRHGARRVLLAVVACATLSACGSSPAEAPVRPQYDLHHPSATRRVMAVSNVIATRDTRYVPDLILLLVDEDESVRLAAGQALKDLTGRNTGYRASDPPAVRAAQMQAWQAWWRSTQAGAPPPSAAGAARAP